ncbi:MAG: hypothetical protein Q4G50_02970 [Corynebacterium sp.]|uniref:hypothetical protein n=1 Tax=Corynebacterium sp. TaxID=1720 RepID=UPI0026E038F2|nr:hypothetical protein [Corynebacterium sp.]MDO5668946.1 hypothetical protein [Corynebacterium sp.]
MSHITAVPRILGVALLATTFAACVDDSTDATPETVEVTVTEEVTLSPTPTGQDNEFGIPGSAFVEKIAAVPETDAAPFASSLTMPQQPGWQFVGPDGTYCEMYSEESVLAMCTHQGEGDFNAVSVHQGEPATTHNVNRIFMATENTQPLQPGQRIKTGPVSCAVAEGETRVMCAVDFYSFAVSTEGVELG